MYLDISIDGDTAVAFTENVEQRFLSYGWQVLRVTDGDKYASLSNFERVLSLTIAFISDLEGIYNSIADARKEKNKPTIICLRTTIGFGSKQQGTHGVHGSRMCLYIYLLHY
jgi:transketolase